MLIRRNLAKAMSGCVADSSARYTLGSVLAERTAGGICRLVATDGCQLTVVQFAEEDPTNWRENWQGRAIRSSEFSALVDGKSLKKAAGAAKPGKRCIDALNNILIDEPETSKNGHVQIVATDGQQAAQFSPDKPEGRFPKWKECCEPQKVSQATHDVCDDIESLVVCGHPIPAHYPAERLAEIMGLVRGLAGPRSVRLNIEVLQRALTALAESGIENVNLSIGDPNGPVHVTGYGPDVIGGSVVMPMTFDEGPDMVDIIGDGPKAAE